MKSKIPANITTVTAAREFLEELFNNGESYHPEDDAHDIVWNGVDVSEDERNRLNIAMIQIHAIPDFDPCEFLLDLAGHVTECGCHSVKETTEFFAALKKAGLDPIDTSWNNDASDSVEVVINGDTYRVWIGDPASTEDEYYRQNHLVKVHPEHSDMDEELPGKTIEEIIATLKSL